MTRPLRTVRLSACVLASVALACGMRGPPRAPLVIVPERVSEFSARRLADRVYVQFQIPSANADGDEPADLDRVEIYATTAQPGENQPRPGSEEWLDLATLVTTVRVAEPGAPDPSGEGAENDASHAQGDEVTVVEELTPDVLVPVAVDDEDPPPIDEETVDEEPVPGPLVSPPLPRPVRRTYVAIAVSTRGRESRPSSSVAVPLGGPPSPPSSPVVSYTEEEISIVWSPAVTARLPVQEPDTDSVLSSSPILEPQIPTRYEVYDVSPVAEADAMVMPEPLDSSPLTVASHSDRRIEFGVERCYAVRTVDSVDSADTLEIRSQPSESTCVSLVDTFPPAAPTRLVAVASEGAVSLGWAGNTEVDIAGYFVLRGRPRRRPAAVTLDLLIVDPVEETNYRDTTVEVGVSYVYAVQAVDRAMPPNVSELSDQVVEQAR